MRIWEFDDKKEIPSNLVKEQDFILRVRRMQRRGLPCLVLNIILTAIEPLNKNPNALESVQKKLQTFVTATGGSYYEMSNGDVFLSWETPGESKLLASKVVESSLSEFKSNTNIFLLSYRMPENYALLRERTNDYIEKARARAALGLDQDKVDESSGRLTAKNVDQIEQLLADIDVRRYGRTQRIYQDNKGSWTPIAEEYFVSFENLRREHFPKLDIARSEHFFFALCSLMDQKLLGKLTSSFDTLVGRTINLNLSVSTVLGSVFAQFVRTIPKNQKHLVGFELHCGDLFQDFAMTLSAIEILKREGFRIILDSITPIMTGYVHFQKFPVDMFKINVTKDYIPQLTAPDIRETIKKIPPEKLLFSRCDNENALILGRQMGVSYFQGWLIDDLASKKG